MDRKISQYENILINWLQTYCDEAADPETEYQLICDQLRHIYQVVRIGWDKKNTFWNVVLFHFQIKPADG